MFFLLVLTILAIGVEAWPMRQNISILVASPCVVYNTKIIGLQLVQPSCNLTLWILQV